MPPGARVGVSGTGRARARARARAHRRRAQEVSRGRIFFFPGSPRGMNSSIEHKGREHGAQHSLMDG